MVKNHLTRLTAPKSWPIRRKGIKFIIRPQAGAHSLKNGISLSLVVRELLKYAKTKKLDVVLIDTAGRVHSNTNLVEELKKISRVVKPDVKVFVGESITGNDCVEQAKKFNDSIELDGVILTKADVDEKGGTAISISYVLGKPILYLGTGQDYGDIEKFNTKKIMESLGW